MSRKWPLFFVLSVSVLALSSQGDAKPKKGSSPKEEAPKVIEPVWPSPLDPGAMDSVFTELPFGKGHDEVLAVLAERLEEQLKPVLKVTGNARERDSMKEGLRRSIDEVRASYAEFKGQQTPYAVSVVADEYRDNVGEALMRYAYVSNHAYFFFSGGKLWKLLLCLEDGTLAQHVAKGLERYGQAADVFWADEAKTLPLRSAWKDTTFEVSFEPPDDIFTCNRLVWVFLPEKEAVMKTREEAKSTKGGSSSADDLLKQIMAPPDKAPAPSEDSKEGNKKKGK